MVSCDVRLPGHYRDSVQAVGTLHKRGPSATATPLHRNWAAVELAGKAGARSTNGLIAPEVTA